MFLDPRNAGMRGRNMSNVMIEQEQCYLKHRWTVPLTGKARHSDQDGLKINEMMA